MPGIPFGNFELLLDLPTDQTDRALSRIIDTKKRKWTDRVASHRAYSGQVHHGDFSFKKAEGRSLILGLRYKAKIYSEDSKTRVKVRTYLNVPGLLFSTALLVFALYWTFVYSIEAFQGNVVSQYLLAPTITGVAAIYYNSFFLAREEKLRTRVNLRERIENMVFEATTSAFETDEIWEAREEE